MKKICKQCNEEFETTDNRQQFCNSSCSAKFTNRNRTFSPGTDKRTKKIKCTVCSKEMEVNIRAGKNTKCNSCKERYKDNIKVCTHCGKPSKYKYCTEECKLNHIGNTCLTCGKKTLNMKFCSVDCSIKYTNNNIHKHILSGEYLTFCEQHIRKLVKRYLIDVNGHKCEICGCCEWMGSPVPLICDHIDGDHTNNVMDNFRLVCCNCDAQLPTYKSKNMGKGRKYDREYRNKMKI